MDERSTFHGALIASAVAVLFCAQVAVPMAAAEEAQIHCYGVNACKGKGDCGGKGHSCAGENACKGKGYLKLDKETCLKVNGGRLTEKPVAKKS
jgi:uncharacterized membrane protein